MIGWISSVWGTGSTALGIVAGGFFGGIVVALLLALLLELRKGKIVERWQVYQMKLPILAELRLPSGPRD